jgi:DNA adenine methylase
MKPFFCRVGSKRTLVKRILPLFPEHRVYVEPFIGGGAIYFAKEPSEVEVINDLDKDLIDGYKNLKTLQARDFPKSLNTVPELQTYLDRRPRSKKMELIQDIIRFCNGFVSGIPSDTVYKPSDPYAKLKKIDQYQQRLQHTRITNKDYAKVLKEWDSPETFFYLDPPYEKSEGLYAEDTMDFEEMRRNLEKVKGKWLLSINDSKTIRTVFKGFPMKQVCVKPVGNKGVGQKARLELLIANYPLPKR